MGKGFKKSKSLKNKNIKNNLLNKKDEKLPSQRKIARSPKKQKQKDKTFINNPIINKEKRIKLKALKYFNIQPNKNVKEMNINELKIFAHKFDINPDINYRLLFFLKKNEPGEYTKYLPKYKYTLDFQKALYLNCFENKDIENTLEEYNKHLVNYKLKSEVINSINDIHSFSRLKLFNFFFFFLENDFTNMKGSDILQKILSHSIPQTLVFKIPNKYGSIELQYYTYIIVLANIFLQFFNLENNSKYEKKDFISLSNKDTIYFNFQKNEKPQEEEIDLNEFYQRKKLLTDYLIGFDTEIKLEKKIRSVTKSYNENSFLKKISVISVFSKNIKELIAINDDLQVLGRIKFIIDCILFYPYETAILEKYSNCIEINNNLENKENPNNYAFKNLNYLFKKTNYNLFDNHATYYLFPDLLKKNIIQKDEELFISFKNLLKHIYNSKLIKDIYYLTSEFKEFKYPFDDEDIFEEVFDMSIFLPFSYVLASNALFGFTLKEFPEILIPANLNEYEYNFSKIACQLSQILNTCIHEQLKHYMKALIFYNSFRFGISKRINSDLLEIDEERKLINSILYKNNIQYNLIPLDGGEKAEIFLYGNILGNIYFSQSLELYKLSNWNKTIPEHIENFIKCLNKKGSEKFELIEIEKDKDFCGFFKILAKKYKQYFLKDNETKIEFNYTASAGKIPKNIMENNQKGDIVFNYESFVEIERNVRDTNWWI